MTKEDKELLLKDISARLPYGVKLLHTPTNEITNLEMIGNGVIDGNIHDLIENFKPYLFPLSSMTKEQREEFLNIQSEERKILFDALIEYKYGQYDKIPVIAPYKQIEWFNKNHFDYRGLIPMGSAIDATGKNIY